MTKSEFAMHVYLAYIEWHAKYGEAEAFTYAMGVAYGIVCAGKGKHFSDVVGGFGSKTHMERLDTLRTCFD